MRASLLGCVLGLAGCAEETLPPAGHAVLYLDTDAPVPGGPADGPTPLFDRIRVEVVPPGREHACDGCTRVFDLDAALLRNGASFTVTIPGSVVHVLMYVGRFSVNQEPSRGSTVERWVRVPSIPLDGDVRAMIFLPTEDAGLVRGSRSEPLEPEPVAPSRVGTWGGAQRIGCSGSPRAGEVCVPGGAFWMGGPLYRQSQLFATDRQRLVVLRPFYIDDREMTVSTARPFAEGRPTVFSWSGSLLGNSLANWCRFTVDPGPFEEVPVNCIARDDAIDICAERDGLLPSEAQFEYVAGALGSQTFGWGEEEPSCDDAVFARGGAAGVMSTAGGVVCKPRLGQSGTARNGGPVPLPRELEALGSLVALSRARAAVALAGGKVWDLAGNLSELTRDRFALQDEPCWSNDASNVFIDPVCETASTSAVVRALGRDQFALRGGSWSDAVNTLRAAARTPANGDASPQVGFRCVRPAG